MLFVSGMVVILRSSKLIFSPVAVFVDQFL